MGVISRFEGGVENAVDRAAGAVFKSPIEPAQIAKRAEKQMNREKLVGAGRQFAPTLYNVLVNPNDDKRLFGFYPTLAAEVETYLMTRGSDAGLEFDGRPLVRFIVDGKLKSGKFDVIAETVAAPIIKRLREEEIEYYGLSSKPARNAASGVMAAGAARGAAAAGAVVDEKRLNSRADPAPVSGRNSLDRLPSLDGLPSLDRSAGTVKPASLINVGTGAVFALDARQVTVGRDPSNPIVVVDANASRMHAQFSQDATGVWKVTDLNSTNGTLLNDRAVSKALLRDGDLVTIGVTVLEFRERGIG